MRQMLAGCLLCAVLFCGTGADAASLIKANALDYTILDLTLENSPREICQTLKRKGYLLTKTQHRDGLEVRSFTAAKRQRLYAYAYLAACIATGQTVGIYAVGEDGVTMQELARNRYGLSGLDTVPQAGKDTGEDTIGGPMRLGRTYRKDYPNVSISFYQNRDFPSWTLAFESPDALAACRRRQESIARTEKELRQSIEAESARARIVD
ncbi:MAG: hypothetical protein Q4F27_01345 [Desulfovibrionaceae bacterium]|nr:hypothetical protein [Desulfovibrionaceae bacterium]